jgi:hypothetical protein
VEVARGLAFKCQRCASDRFVQEVRGTPLPPSAHLTADAVLRCADCDLGVPMYDWMSRNWPVQAP